VSTFDGVEDLLRHEGTGLGTTGWHLVDQPRVDAFAEVTGDRQWIHVDPERAKAESPFGGTVAHGALTLSLCMTFLDELVKVRNVSHVVNAGFDRVRFRAPVPVGSRLRGTGTLRSSQPIGGGTRVDVRIKVEIQGESMPACVADHVLVFYR
jgi:acyl dehydratase